VVNQLHTSQGVVEMEIMNRRSVTGRIVGVLNLKELRLMEQEQEELLLALHLTEGRWILAS